MSRTCQHKGCTATLSHTNKRGLCKSHIHTCAADGCEEWIGKENKSGLCREHKAHAWREQNTDRLCAQCGDTLHRNNKLGVCGRCKSINRQRAMKRCKCGQSLEPRNKSGRCFKCLHPGVTVITRKRKSKPDPPYTVTELTQSAASLTFTSIADIYSDKKPKRIARIRFAIWHLAEPHFSYPHIGRMSGDRDHSTIMHGCHRAADLLETDKGFQILVNEIRSQTLARLANERKAA